MTEQRGSCKMENNRTFGSTDFSENPIYSAKRNQKRSKLEIYLDVLKTIDAGTRKPTRIMYRANLSWVPLVKILESLLDQNLITQEEDHKHTVYHITENGRNVLQYFNEAMELIEIRV